MKPRFSVLLWVLIVTLLALVSFEAKSRLVPLHTRLISEDDDMRNLALDRMGKLPPEKRPALEVELIGELANTDPKARRYALYSLRKLNATSPAALNAVVDRLNDSDEAVRKEAQVVLLDSGKAIPVLTATLSQPSIPMRKIAIDLLARSGAQAKSALPEIQKNLNHPDSDLRLEAGLALMKIDPPGLAALPIITEAAAREPWNSGAFKAAEALSKLGVSAASAAPVLERALRNGRDGYLKGPYQRLEAARTLSKIAPRKETLTDWGWDLKQRNMVVRYRAAVGISELIPPNPGAVPMLLEALNDRDNFTAARAMSGLVKIGLENTDRLKDQAIPAMLQLFERMTQDKNVEGFFEMAQPALLKMGPSLLPYIERAKARNLLNPTTAQVLLDRIKK